MNYIMMTKDEKNLNLLIKNAQFDKNGQVDKSKTLIFVRQNLQSLTKQIVRINTIDEKDDGEDVLPDNDKSMAKPNY